MILLKHWIAHNHPVSELSMDKRNVYLKGMGAALHAVMGSDSNLATFFGVWTHSVLGQSSSTQDFFEAGSICDIKRAIRVENKWWQFCRVRDTFFFDLMYLATFDGDYSRASRVAGFFNKGFGGSIKRHALSFSRFPGCISDGSSISVSSSQIALLKENMAVSLGAFYKVLVVANVSAGKSTLINALTGKRFCRSSNLPCTGKVHYVFNRRIGQSALFRRGEQFYEINHSGFLNFDSISFPFHVGWEGVPICFIDSPGMNNSENGDHASLSYSVIKKGEYDLLLYVSNAQYFDTVDERKALETVYKFANKKRVLFVLNQLDSFNPETDSISRMMASFRSILMKCGFKNPMIFPTSGYASLVSYLSEVELGVKGQIDKEYLSSAFGERYFDLPSYLGLASSDKTGVELLEKTIKSFIRT